MKILILYTKAGGGHLSIATGLKERIEENIPNAEVILKDPLSSVLETVYKASTVISPHPFNLLTDIAEKRIGQAILKRINNVANIRIRASLESIEPDLIISTHIMLVDNIVRVSHSHKIPFAVYIADPFYIHPFWFSKEVDKYFVFDKDEISEALKKEYNDKIISIGMPLRKAFYKKYDANTVRGELGFNNNMPIIFFGGSGAGMDYLERLIPKVRNLLSEVSIQAIFVCGRNKIIERTLMTMFSRYKNVRIFGYLDDEKIAKMLQISDIFVGKMGPNIMFESLLSNTPIIATPPIISQEKLNRKFIVDNSLGYAVSNSGEAIENLKGLIQNPKLMKEMKQNAVKVHSKISKIENEGIKEMTEWILKCKSKS